MNNAKIPVSPATTPAKPKSILDGIPVKDETKKAPVEDGLGRLLHVISECPQCGSPIYGTREVRESEPLLVRLSCSCNQKCSPMSNKLSDSIGNK